VSERPPRTEAELWPVPRRLGAVVFAAAVISHLWVLDLGFQLDDYRLLADPLGLFRAVPAAFDEPVAAGLDPFMLRWPAWLYWGVIAKFAGDPLSPVPFHFAALLLHGATSALLAVIVGRLLSGTIGRYAGILAGLGFAFSAGGTQAVSWTSANPDLLVCFFGLWGLRCFLKARDPRRDRRSLRGLLFVGFLSIWIALLSKTPALVLVPACAFALWTDMRTPRRPWRRDLLLLLLATLLTFLCRWLYLGSVRLRYGTREAPSLWEAPAYVWRGLGNVGQGLFPWNRSPLFDGDGPFLGEWVLERLGVGAPLLAAVASGLVLFSAWSRCPRSRPALSAAFFVLIVLAMPGALLYTGNETNVHSRTVYLPLLAAFGGLGVAASHLLHSAKTRGIGRVAVVAWALLLLDSSSHVANTEALAARDREQRIELVRAAHREQSRVDPERGVTVLAVVPEAGYGGIPGHGVLLRWVIEPPFWSPPAGAEDTPLRLEVFTDEAHLARSLYDLDLGAAGVQAIGPSRSAEAKAGVALRAEHLPRTWTALRPGLTEAELAGVTWSLDAAAEGREVWYPDPPLPPHSVEALRLRMPPGGPAAARVLLRQGRVTTLLRVRFPRSTEDRVTVVKPPTALRSFLGGPIAAIEFQWEPGGAPLSTAPEPLWRGPRLELHEPADMAEVQLIVHGGPPGFSFSVPDPSAAAPYARFEMVFFPTTTPMALFSDVRMDRLDPKQGRLRFLPTHLHADITRVPRSTDPAPAWSALMSEAESALRAAGQHEGYFEWRIATLHPGGEVAAQSPWRGALFSVPELED